MFITKVFVVALILMQVYSKPINEEKSHENAIANYKYSYGVRDAKTGDIKSHHEERNGDVVKGQYTITLADGSERIVQYTVDKDSGFKTVIFANTKNAQPQHASSKIADFTPTKIHSTKREIEDYPNYDEAQWPIHVEDFPDNE